MSENWHKWLIKLFNDGQQLGLSDAELLGKTAHMHLLIENNALTQSGNQRSIICPLCDDPHDVLIDPINFDGYCQENGMVKATPDMLINYTANPTWLLDALRTTLDVSASSPCKALINDRVWSLGQSRIGDKMVPVYLARSPEEDTAFLTQYFRNNPGNSPGIVFLTFPHQMAHDLPNGHRPILLANLLDMEQEKIIVDRILLQRIWQGTDENQAILTYSPDFKTVTHYGKTHVFRGEQQRKVVTYLIKAHESGNPVVITSEMMSRLDMDSTRQIPHLFKGHKTWETLISYGNSGTCRIRIA